MFWKSKPPTLEENLLFVGPASDWLCAKWGLVDTCERAWVRFALKTMTEESHNGR